MLKQWPDALTKPSPEEVEELLTDFWNQLADLPSLLHRHEYLLTAECIAEVRLTMIRLVLALNGISRPGSTSNLNSYLSPRQRTVLQRTLLTPNSSQRTWLGQAVALVVVYRWYAYQLADKYYIRYPTAAEQMALSQLSDSLPKWPRTITTD